MVKTVDTVVTYLEMTEPHYPHVPMPANIKLMLMRLEEPTVQFYRYLYDAVGGAHVWVDRKKLSGRIIMANISQSACTLDGTPTIVVVSDAGRTIRAHQVPLDGMFNWHGPVVLASGNPVSTTDQVLS